MDEQFVNELATALRKVGTIHTVGEEWHSYTGEIPVGGVPYCGQMVTRATYSALWAYAQEKNLVLTEANWQMYAEANGGNVPFYSSGDGSTTFRMPKIVGYVKGASSQSEAGTHLFEGLPNITGNLTTENASDYNFISDASMGQIGESGAFYISKWTNKYVTSKGGTSLYSPVALDFNASYSNPIYGASDHVTPETSIVMFGVYAFGAIVETGALDATTLSNGLATLESNVATLENTKLENSTPHVIEAWSNGTNWYRKWSDGWIEQGGTLPAQNGEYTLTFPKAFSNTNYSIFKNVGLNGGGQLGDAYACFYALTTSSAKTMQATSYAYCRWYACGY